MSRPAGVFAAFKGPQLEEELPGASNAIRVLGGKLDGVERYELPGGDQRRLAVVRKVRSTGKQYPRQGGKIKKDPL